MDTGNDIVGRMGREEARLLLMSVQEKRQKLEAEAQLLGEIERKLYDVVMAKERAADK